MRIKTFIAKTNTEAIELVREGLGNNAIIISSGNTGDGNSVSIIAAVNITTTPKIKVLIEEENEQISDLNIEEKIKQAPVFHLPPGSEKTTIKAKLCTQTKLKKCNIKATSRDTQRAGSILADADSASLALLSASISAKIADELKHFSPISLTYSSMPHTDNNIENQQYTEATNEY